MYPKLLWYSLLVISTILQEVIPIKLFHYTDKSGADAIQTSGYFRKSDNFKTDAAFGIGVYLTSMSPFKNTRKEIGENNWGKVFSVNKTHYVFELDMDTKSVTKAENTSRDIYIYPKKDVYPKNDLYLNDTNGWTLYDWTSETPRVRIAVINVGVAFRASWVMVITTLVITVTTSYYESQ